MMHRLTTRRLLEGGLKSVSSDFKHRLRQFPENSCELYHEVIMFSHKSHKENSVRTFLASDCVIHLCLSVLVLTYCATLVYLRAVNATRELTWLHLHSFIFVSLLNVSCSQRWSSETSLITSMWLSITENESITDPHVMLLAYFFARKGKWNHNVTTSIKMVV